MPNRLSVLVGIIVISASYFALQALSGHGWLVVGSLLTAANALLLWPKAKRHARAQDTDAAKSSNTSGKSTVVKVTLAEPAYYRHRLAVLEDHLATVKSLERDGSITDPLALAALLEEIRYSRVMLQIAEQVVTRAHASRRS